MPSQPARPPNALTQPRVQCATPGVADIIEAIAAEVSDAGAYISPRLVIDESNGRLAGHAAGNESPVNSPLVVLNDETLPSILAAKWAWTGEGLAVDPAEESEPRAARLLKLHAELYSILGKPLWYRAAHPRAVLASSTHDASATLALARKLRPGFKPDSSPRGFLQTRVYDRNGDSCLLPIVDILNHHPAGAPLAYAGGKLTVQERHPTGTSECFDAYGGLRRDALDLALHYGYADPHVRIATSAPVAVEVSGIGTVQVGREFARLRSPLDPPRAQPMEGGLSLSHLTFQASWPHRLLTPMAMLLTSMGKASPASLARELLAAVIQQNLELLANLQVTLNQATPMGSMLATACGNQARNFRDFASAIGVE